MKTTAILPRFSRSKVSEEFFSTLNNKIENYFKKKNIGKTGNIKLYAKTIVLLSVYISTYGLLFYLPPSNGVALLLIILLGITMAGLGMNVMHDGNHGSYSSKNWVNKLMGASIYILAGNVYNWKVQHNVLHHTFTNVEGHDEDLDAGRLIRLSDKAEWRWYHRYQHIYSILLYGFLTLNWALFVDFDQTNRYLKRKLSCGTPVSPTKQWTGLVLTKILYFSIWIVLPILFSDYAWWKILIGFVAMHYVAGLILSVIFQLAHVVEDTETMLPNEKNKLENTWAVHQLYTTANFARKGAFISWYSGGLNHQIEHHLFPHISHIHYKSISLIVKETAKQFKLPYHEFKSTREAIMSHFKHLKVLGKKL